MILSASHLRVLFLVLYGLCFFFLVFFLCFFSGPGLICVVPFFLFCLLSFCLLFCRRSLLLTIRCLSYIIDWGNLGIILGFHIGTVVLWISLKTGMVSLEGYLSLVPGPMRDLVMLVGYCFDMRLGTIMPLSSICFCFSSWLGSLMLWQSTLTWGVLCLALSVFCLAPVVSFGLHPSMLPTCSYFVCFLRELLQMPSLSILLVLTVGLLFPLVLNEILGSCISS